MKLVVFGATGRTGRLLVQQALERGHQVTAFARSPQKLAGIDGAINLVQGDVLDAAAVARAVGDGDAVLSVLGPTSNRPDYQVTLGTENILRAMVLHSVERLVISAGAGVPDVNDRPGPFHKLINLLLRLFSRHVYEDMRRTVQLVRNSGVNWTVVRVPVLTDGAAQGPVRVGYVGRGTGARLSREDLAAFMLDAVESGSYVGQAPVISH